ncbi:uncharacterized protein MONOS_681 [Monocercomonoides exilis]|uniref:uncharacterized protein n=1 Tax=Monocercomonoides exilis TaxID=2049356 RepID=UPI003559FAB6|nr:hypothetical protein MONOS_681 [Monocercomonoides exilis]|eukprot:MONOS_681.1-p1 / transcript=MONOS_681.1 / gene=MONOS_681 / organism=Monocercomonoides_exilis_PA203 / gene_product=unspecified product / transcript_product=unspecified product / location=Mono_scaffold00011:149547-150686(+) / protein_length=267 / sequence_SO=supercontig / SO=protein_coding / is_pseudo=false
MDEFVAIGGCAAGNYAVDRSAGCDECDRVMGVAADVCGGSFGGYAGSVVGVLVDVVSFAGGYRDSFWKLPPSSPRRNCRFAYACSVLDSVHSASARSLTSSSGAHRSASPHQVAGVQRKSPRPACGSAGASAQCGVLLQLAGHLIAEVVGFVACERSVELAARTAARALETVAVQMLHCAFVSALSCEDKKRDGKSGCLKRTGSEERGTALGRLAGLGGGLVKSAREKMNRDLAKSGFNDRSSIAAAVPLKVQFGQLQEMNHYDDY